MGIVSRAMMDGASGELRRQPRDWGSAGAQDRSIASVSANPSAEIYNSLS
jgi:hypothetical protein